MWAKRKNDNRRIADRKFHEPNYIVKLFLSFRNLWGAQDILRISNIRIGYLHYLFAFPLALIFVNIQNSLLASNLRVLGLPSITISFISFAVGATAMFCIYSVKNIHVASKISSILTLLGFIPWLFMPPDGNPAFLCATIFMMGVGCCMTNSGLSFMFVLNNAERFFGCVLMTFFISFVNINSHFVRQQPVMRISLISILVVGISICMYKTKGSDFTEINNKSAKGFDPSIWLSLFILLSYFIIRILGFYVPEFHIQLSPLLSNILALVPALFCVIMQVAFNRSVWIMCNVFFISAIMIYVMGFANIIDAAYVFSGMKEIGLLVGFYLFTCVVNKFCDFRLHKVVSLICISTIGAVFVVPDILMHTTLTHTVAVTISFGLFLVFLLLSPAFSMYLFSADWSRDFAKLHMSEIKAQVALVQTTESNRFELSPNEMDDLFTPEERDVAMLLIEGETRYGISRRLHRSAAEIDRQLSAIRDKVIRKGDPDPGIAAAVYVYKLTRRETDMLRCLCRYMTNADIAANLIISEETVKKHVRSLMAKLPVDDRKEVPEWVATLGMKTE